MTVAVDAATEHVRTGTTSPQTFSHAGAASGVKGVVLALVHGVSSTDHVTAASYGGVALARIQRNVDTATEPGAAELWFLGSGVPQGAQTVSYTPGGTTDDFHAAVITLTGADDLEVVAQGGVSENIADPSVTLAYGGRTCMAFAALYGGGAAPTSFTPNANCQTVHDHDLGAFYSEVIRQTTAGSANFVIGGTAGSDDVAFAAIAVSEVLVNVTGTASPTEAADTSSASGTVSVVGTASASEAADAGAASGLVTVTGSASPVEADDTVAASGEVAASNVTGSAAVIEADDAAAASGVVLVAGSAAPVEAADTALASGLVVVTGSAAPAEAQDTASAAGLVLENVTGTGAAIEEDDTVSAFGNAGPLQQPSEGSWRKLTGEYPKRRERAHVPQLQLLPTAPAIAPPAVQPQLRAVVAGDSPYRERLLGDLGRPSAGRKPRRLDDDLAIALLLAA